MIGPVTAAMGEASSASAAQTAGSAAATTSGAPVSPVPRKPKAQQALQPAVSLRQVKPKTFTTSSIHNESLQEGLSAGPFQLWALLGSGLMLVLFGLATLPGPFGWQQLILAAGAVLLVGACFIALNDIGSLARLGESNRLQRLGDKVEAGIEHLKDIQWQQRETETRYRDLLDYQQEIVLRRDDGGRLTYINRAGCKTFLIECQDILGKEFQPRVLEGGDPGPLRAGGKCSQRDYVQLIETAYGPRWYSWKDQLVRSSGGVCDEVQTVGRDVTEQVAVQMELSEARDQAEAASQAKSRFLAAMSHEIRTPMNGILGMTQLLNETSMSAQQQTFAQAIDSSASTLLALIDEILDFSKIESGKMVLETKRFCICKCVQDVVELLAPRAHEKDLEIAWAVDPSLPGSVLGDKARLRQIIMNLVGNAVKFTDDGGVLITVEHNENAAPRRRSGDPLAVKITIKDTGIGMSEEGMGRLFAEFEQADLSHSRQQGGTGLGLAISRRLANAMQGDITVTSEERAGSVFTIYVELACDEAPRQDAALRPDYSHILLAISRPMQRRAMQLMLEGVGIAVEDAPLAQADRLLRHAAQEGQPFDAIITDGCDDPAMSHIQIKLARSLNPGRDVRGIVLIDPNARACLSNMGATGFDAFLVRPVRPRSLLAQLGIVTKEPAQPAPGSSNERAQGPKPDNATPWREARILLVEDNAINALLATRMLEQIGCTTCLASDGVEAVEQMRAVLSGTLERFDLILMDMRMPRLDGLSATRKIQALFAQAKSTEVYGVTPDTGENSNLNCLLPPIAALTANAFSEDRDDCLSAGMDDYLAKPFERAALEALLKKWCGAANSSSEQVAYMRMPPRRTA